MAINAYLSAIILNMNGLNALQLKNTIKEGKEIHYIMTKRIKTQREYSLTYLQPIAGTHKYIKQRLRHKGRN